MSVISFETVCVKIFWRVSLSCDDDDDDGVCLQRRAAARACVRSVSVYY